VSGGFAIVQPGSKLSINAVEGYPLEDFSAEVGYFVVGMHSFSYHRQSVRNQIAEAQKIAGGSGSEHDIAEARIELEVCTSGYGELIMTCGLTMCRSWRACRQP